ncbi:ArsR/SmtB family transcription factor [Sinomicrobium oceani]|uniref:ArsR/SmtB family transcription factor n=1 Tax=Sinomicrobium oceani TaxID=1150368 RepID=UPI00227A4676|nr:metalloregulator ArsR/SmtB family transcription factor [Sinomicrobium oceani]
MEARRDVFQAIADPTRREILNLIAHKSQNVSTIAENFEISRQAISLQIKILEECGLIKVNKQGRERHCRPQLEKLHEVAAWIEPFRKIWEARFNELDNLLDELQSRPKSEN